MRKEVKKFMAQSRETLRSGVMPHKSKITVENGLTIQNRKCES